MGIQVLAGKFAAAIINPLLVLVISAGLLIFLYGLVEYLYALNVKGKKSQEGLNHMLYGIVGMFIMVAALSIIKVIADFVGANLPPGY